MSFKIFSFKCWNCLIIFNKINYCLRLNDQIVCPKCGQNNIQAVSMDEESLKWNLENPYNGGI